MKDLYKNIFVDKYGNPKIEGLKSPLFLAGLGIKIILSCFFASHFLRDLFAPFLNYFVESGFANPYAEFNGMGAEEHFPYPDIMLYIMSVPRLIFSPLLSHGIYDVSALHLFVFRLPLLIFDFIILLVLLRWLKTKHKQVLWLYWLSPIVMYINYFHGQLDIIPIGILIVSLYFLFKQKWVLSIIVLAIACATKTNIIVVVPFIFIYAFKNNLNVIKCATLALIFIGMFAAVQLPYLFNTDYQQMVFANKVQTKVFDAHLPFGNYMLYFIVSAYFILLFRAITFTKINRNLLMLFLAFSFGVLTLFITPMQGWYMWLVPFFIYFVIQFNETQKYLYFVMVALYFIYFSTVPNSDIAVPFDLTEQQTNIIFTLLQTCLGVFLFALYHHGIRNIILQKLNYKPFLMGVGGDSGAGKSTFSNLIELVMGINSMSIVRGDDMHRWERGNEQWKTFTHLNPKANDLHQDLQHTKALKEGKSIYRKHYDHNNGQFTLPQYIKSNTLVLFEGLHPFYLKSQADLYDLKIFFNPDESIRVARKIKRDSTERDKPAEAVKKQLEDRKEDSEKYINIQKEHADIIVNYTEINNQECLRLYMKNEIEIDELINAILTNSGMSVEHQYLDNNMHELVFKGTLSSNIVELIAYDQLQGLEEIGIYNSKWESDYKGVIQLMTIQAMLYYLKS